MVAEAVRIFSCFRSVMVYGTKRFDLVQRISKIKSNRPSSKAANSTVCAATSDNGVQTVTPRKPEKHKDYLRIFLDTGMVE